MNAGAEGLGLQTISKLSEVVQRLREQGVTPALRKICFVTDELPGLFRNGGAGTATLGLARRLIAEGHSVAALYTSGVDLKDPVVRRGVDELTEFGLKLSFLSEVNETPNWSATNRHRSYAAYCWLKQQDFDLVLFHDFSGLGFYSCQAKRAAAAFRNTLLTVVTHGSSSWGWELMEELIRSPEMLEQEFIERTAVENADVVISPSEFLVRWMRNRKYKLPARTYVQRNIMPDPSDAGPRLNPSAHYPVNEIVFFGRHELRKGFHIFVEAMAKMGGDFNIPKITFLGKYGMIHGEHSGAYAVDRLKRVPNELNFLADFDRDEAIRYLKRSGVLAVMPSIEENLPSVVYECVIEGINFVASNRGGTSELLDEQTRAERLYNFPDEAPADVVAAALLQKIGEIVQSSGKPTRLSFDPEDSAATYADWHALVPVATLEGIERARPLVSVVVIHHDRPRFLRLVLDSIESQTYPNLEIVVVDDGSKTAAAKVAIDELRAKDGPRPLKVIETPDLFLGGARNAGARVALGEYLIFVDDDNVAMPTMVETLVRAAQSSSADVVTCLAHVLRGNGAPTGTETVEYLPLGGAAAVGCFNNCFGDANALFRRQPFDVLGGFLGNRVGAEDWELMARATLNGYRVFVLPEALYYYRIHQDSLTAKPHSIRDYNRQIAHLYYKSSHECLKDVILVTQGHLIEPKIRAAAWELIGRRPKGEFERQLIGIQDVEETKRLMAILLGEFRRYVDASRMAMQLRSHEASLSNIRHILASAPLTSTLPIPHAESANGGNSELIPAEHSSCVFRITTSQLQAALAEGMPPPEKKSLVNFDANFSELQVHPKQRTVVWARLPRVLPRGTLRVVAQALTRNDQAAIVEYGLAVEGWTSVTDRLIRQLAPTASFRKANSRFSGWVQLDPMRQAEIELKFPAPLSEPHDLLLATRPHNGKGGTHYAWARFFDIRYEIVEQKG